jgi:hypothetical protein
MSARRRVDAAEGLLIVTHTGSPGNIVALHPLHGFRFGWKTGSNILAKML